VVDLDGAATGERRNQAVIKKIVKALRIPVETGGGIRSREAVDDYLNAGIDRAILGTKVVADRGFLADVLKVKPENVIQTWLSYEGGFEDMLCTMYILFGKRTKFVQSPRKDS
jgi:phosphoribosylformimino-5-aminoimidazole carboxamide ribonucleotide (ProFAR) isomerase